MNEQNFDVNKLRVASPCPANWAEMRGDDKTRFCDLCSLNVYNFSEMTSEEIQRLITKSDGRICGRMYKRADGTVLTQDCPVGIRAYYKRTARFAGAALTAILGLFSVSFAQSDSKKNNEVVPASKTKISKTVNQTKEMFLSGTVVDVSGAVIAGAEVNLVNKDRKLTVRSNDEGKYKFVQVPAGNYDLNVMVPGFKFFNVSNLQINSGESIQADFTLEAGEVLTGVVDIVREPLINIKSSNITTTITTKQIERIPH